MKTNLKTLILLGLLGLLLGSISGCSKKEVSTPSTPEYDGAYLQDKYGELYELTSTNPKITYIPSVKTNISTSPTGIRWKKTYDCYEKEEAEDIILNTESAMFFIYREHGGQRLSHDKFKSIKKVDEYHSPKYKASMTDMSKFGPNPTFLCGGNEKIPTKTKNEDDTFSIKIAQPLESGLYIIRFSRESFMFRVQ